MSDKKKKKGQQLTDAELKKASGGLRGPGSLDEAGGLTGRQEATPTRMTSRPTNISRTFGSTQGDAPDGTDEINEFP